MTKRGTVLWLALATAYAGQAASTAETYRSAVQPVLAKNCYGCHSDRLKTAGLTLEGLRDPALALRRTDVWEKVVDQLRARRMPPAGLPGPSVAEISAITAWALGLPRMATQQSNLGRVTARRLNRSEY